MLDQINALRRQCPLIKGGGSVSADDLHANSVAIPIEYDIPPSILTRLATQVTVQSDPTGWYLTFYEAVPPFIVGTPDEVRTQLEKVKSLKAECVSRVFIPAARVPEFLAAVQRVSDPAKNPTSKDAKQ
jgi:hypothetical protein